MVDEACGYTGRMLTLLTVTAAIILSIVASSNCNFLRFGNDSGEAWEGLDPPFSGSLQGHVGIFGYEIIDHPDETKATQGCMKYDEKFGKAPSEALMTAQFCALFAPIFGILGLFVSCMDSCFCRFCGSFLISSGLFIIACGVQAGTFALYAEPDFCFKGDQYCDVGISVYMSGASSVLFFCGCLFLCCFPTPDPMFGPKGVSRDRPSVVKQSVVLQPVIIDQRSNGYAYEEEYESDEEESHDGGPARRKSSIVSNNGDKITEDDFNFDTPMGGTSRVETKERTLPDGTRRVDEITYHADGTKTVKTKSYND